MKGLTLEFALERVFDLERREDVLPNRKMIDNYIRSLRNGLSKNKDKYLAVNDITEEQLRLQHGQKRFEENLSSKQLRQFEVKGYDQMINRMLDIPISKTDEDNDPRLKNALALIKKQLNVQHMLGQK